MFMWKKKNRCRRIVLSFQMCMITAAFFLIGCASGGKTNISLEESGPASIEAVKVSSTGGEKTVIDITNSRHIPYTSFRLIDPPRVVLDLRGIPGAGLSAMTSVNDGNVIDICLEKGLTQTITTRLVVGLESDCDYNITDRENIISLTVTHKADEITEADDELSAGSTETGDAEKTEIEPAEPRIFFKPGSTNLSRILGIDFTMLPHGKSCLTLTTDKKAVFSLERKGPKTLILALEEATVPPLLLRRLDSSYFKGVVDQVKSSFSSAENQLSLLISLREMVPYHVDQTDSAIRIDFGATGIKPPEKKIVPIKLTESETAVLKEVSLNQNHPAQPISDMEENLQEDSVAGLEIETVEGNQIPGVGLREYTGALMTMNFVNADVTNILRLIGEVSNLNIVWGKDVKGKVSMRLKNVPWDQALDLILANNDLGMRSKGNVIWVATSSKLNKVEAEEKKKRKEIEEAKGKAKELEPLVTEYLSLDFAKAGEIQGHIEKIKTERGSISVDDRTNTIILQDIAATIEDAKKIVKRFDAPVKQIMIEARIVDASTNFGRDLGVKWNSFERKWQENEGTNWGTDPTEFTTPGDLTTSGTFSTNSPEGWMGNIGLSFARLTNRGLGTVALDATLALAESEGEMKIISAPRVIASNGEKATIRRGSTFYLPVAENVEAKEVKADLFLEVTPTVSYNNYVSMEIKLQDEKQSGNDDDEKKGKEIQTILMVKSGDTIVIGGIYSEDSQENATGIPWLKDIPGIGWMFKAKHRVDNKSELLIFLTPTVLPFHKVTEYSGS